MSDLMFAILDTDGDRHIQEDEFLKMCLLMLVPIESLAAWLTVIHSIVCLVQLHFERIEVPFLERKLPCLRQFRVWRYLTAPKKSRWVSQPLNQPLSHSVVQSVAKSVSR